MSPKQQKWFSVGLVCLSIEVAQWITLGFSFVRLSLTTWILYYLIMTVLSGSEILRTLTRGVCKVRGHDYLKITQEIVPKGYAPHIETAVAGGERFEIASWGPVLQEIAQVSIEEYIRIDFEVISYYSYCKRCEHMTDIIRTTDDSGLPWSEVMT